MLPVRRAGTGGGRRRCEAAMQGATTLPPIGTNPKLPEAARLPHRTTRRDGTEWPNTLRLHDDSA
jgi:hypothetical protein